MIYYKLVKTISNVADLVEIIIKVIVRYHKFFKSIVSDQSLLFKLKFMFLLYYFLIFNKNFLLRFIYRQQLNRETI